VPRKKNTSEADVRAAIPVGLALSLAVAGVAVGQTAEGAPPSEAPAGTAGTIEATPLAPVAGAEDGVEAGGAARAALAAALGAAGAGEREAILGFYETRGGEAFWDEAGRAEALVGIFEAAGAQGLVPARYLELVPEAAEGAAREAALSRAYLRLARDLTGGLVAPSSVDDEINLAPERPEDADLMARLAGGSVEEAVAGLEPPGDEYRALVAEKARLEALAAAGGWGERVPEGPVLREGDRDARVPALRQRLERLGFAVEAETEVAETEVAATEVASATDAEADASRFDAGLAGALARFQAAYGLHDDAVLGAQTLAALNASVDDRIGQILVNLERLRWLGDLGTRYVHVNIPDYTVSVIEDGEAVYHTRSVVGQRSTQTPEFSETMTYLVVNPTWYIPDSIAKRVYLPQLRQDPTVLARNNMRLFTRSGTEIDPALVDFATLGDAFPFRVRQNPSPGNALGRVKFMFPNQFAIYLHDTPARELFARDGRAFSNGCVRLEDPFEFAHYLLAPQLDDPEATFAAWVAAESERYVTLEEPITVHIVYRTAWADAEGEVQYRADVYGRDRRVLEALAARGVAMPGPQG
jgi:L,D-transpeptidase YcbB